MRATSARSPSATSFYAKRLSLVEQMEKNGINKEIRMSREFTGAKSKSLVNEIRHPTGTGASSEAGAAAKADHAAKRPPSATLSGRRDDHRIPLRREADA